MANSATITIGKPENGLKRIQGSTAEWTAADFEDFDVWGAGAAMVNKHDNSIQLRPDLVMRDMSLDYVYDVYNFPDFKTKGEFLEVRDPVYRNWAEDKYKALWVSDAASMWQIQGLGSMGEGSGTQEFLPNQGLMLDVEPREFGGDYSYPSIFELGEHLLFRAGCSGAGNYFSIEFYNYPAVIKFKHTIDITKPDSYPAQKETFEQEWGVNIPEHFGNIFADSNTIYMTVQFLHNRIIVGANGVDETIELRPQHTLDGEVMPYGYGVTVLGRGMAQVAWKPMTYITHAHIRTPVYQANYPLNAPVAAVVQNKRPTGTGITVTGEYRQIEDGKRNEYSVKVDMTGGVYTPSLYRFRMSDRTIRETAGDQDGDLTGLVDTISLSERINDTGEYSGGNLEMILSNVPGINMIRQNAKIDSEISITGEGGSGTLNLNGYYVDVNTITRPAYNMVNLSVNASPITKRLENSFIIEPVSYDDLDLNHVELVEQLCSLAGVTMAHDPAEAGVRLPQAPDGEAPNWQFQRGASIWNCLQTVREYSGWLMYPKNNVLQYRKFPAGATGGTLLDMDDDAFTNISYRYEDNYRTNFMVEGLAEDGGRIVWNAHNRTIEEKIGEERPAIIVDPRISTIEAAQKVAEDLMAFYCTQHFFVNFTSERFERYSDLWIGDIIRIKDSKVNLDGLSFMITGVELFIGQHTAKATIEARSLWT